ncbi:MAG TPA: Uma2 family endonuclease [Thermoanaerobaculia bacterium]|nr:Uma2 family endonuclease [Thermoanaerobaculia bacterium]
MSEPAIALSPLPFELVLGDGSLLESEWHAIELPFLWEVIRQAMAEQGRTDFYVGGDMFVYYSVQQAREVAEEEKKKGLERRAFRGPDVFWVGGVDPDRERKAWISWEEGGRLPDVIFELLSPTTAHKDRTEKRALYAQVFRTAEYFMYDPDTHRLEGLSLGRRSSYRTILPDRNGRLWSERLGASVGLWHGTVKGRQGDWVRLFRPDGSLVPTEAEAAEQRLEAERQRAEAAGQRAEAERQRAEAAEAELARLRALLEKREG